jgi:hypothetical protein
MTIDQEIKEKELAIFVKRNQDGAIVAVSREILESGWEEIPDDAPELAAFAGTIAAGQNELSSTDLGLVRVLEDTIDLLIERGVIRFTDFPEAAQAKLLERRSLRASLRRLDLLEDEGGSEIL